MTVSDFKTLKFYDSTYQKAYNILVRAANDPILRQRVIEAILRRCPECGSMDFVFRGYRENSQQRYKCKNCRRSFSEHRSRALPTRSVVVLSTTDGKTASERGETPAINIQQGLVDFHEWMRNTNKDELTITERMKILNRLIEKACNLYDYREVFKVITNLVREKDPSKPIEEGTKQQWKQAYMQFTKFMGWAIPDKDIPRFKVNRYKISPSDLPTPHEMDCLLARANFQQRLAILVWRDTGASREESAWIQRKDIDFERRIIAINHPVKGHDSRVVPMTSDLYAALRELSPSTNPEEFIFDPTNPERAVVTANLYKRFWNLRKRVAKNTNNPKINQIHPHLLRHGFGVEGAEELGNPYDVKYFMGHKSMSSTDIYTRLARSKGPNDLIVEFCFTPEQEKILREKGFDYIKESKFPDGRTGSMWSKKKSWRGWKS